MGTVPVLVAGRPWVYVANVSRPTLTVYSPTGNNAGVAIVVFPGGGYRVLAIDLEGTEVCDWLTSRGITCVLLKYRVPRSGPSWQPDCRCRINPKPQPALEDAQRAVGLVRLHAAEWHIDSHKVGVLGFSAGGHLVAAISNDFQRRAYPPVDAADKDNCRPTSRWRCIPGICGCPKAGNTRSIRAFTSPATRHRRSCSRPRRTASTMSTSRWVCYIALKDAGVPTEMHLYADGGHAFGLRTTRDPITQWPRLVEKWLRTIGMIAE